MWARSRGVKTWTTATGLVNPSVPLRSQAQQMAVHAVDILESAQRVATLQALQGCTRALATTARVA